MSLKYLNDDFLLRLPVLSEAETSLIHRYDAYLDALTSVDFDHIRQAIRKSFQFFITQQVHSTEDAAVLTWQQSVKLKIRYNNSLKDYLSHIRIRDRKACSIDLATGTGKSWVIYGVAHLMLAEGLVDKVLVVCPSLTIEEELKRKFQTFSGNHTLCQIMTELDACYPSPGIKSANEPILNGDICVENIHAAYQRTGSSIPDSFVGKGLRTLVISDEAHHIYSRADEQVKKWYDFLVSPEYGFQYMLGLSGTPYIGDEYFHDVIYRFSLKQAMEANIIKKIDYKVEVSSTRDNGFDETWQNHLAIQERYAGQLKPITIIVTDKIVTCIQVWHNLVRYLCDKEFIPFEKAVEKAIWVTSGLPSSEKEKAIISNLLTQPEKQRKVNLVRLKSVDGPDNPVEWIISVSMLTEGWDVKNVFQIVPHEQKAFNSKLLIAQVLGRGLRIPFGLKQPILVKINNHERWTPNIINLYNEVLEIENGLSWFYDKRQTNYDFPLYNLSYEPVQDTVETKKEQASDPETVPFKPQSRQREETSVYSESGMFQFTVDTGNIITIDQATREIKLFLKDKDEQVSGRWPISRIKKVLTQSLEKQGCDPTFLTRENCALAKQVFGPLFRNLGRPAPRMKRKPDRLEDISIRNMSSQNVNESAIKDHVCIFYSENTLDAFTEEQRHLFGQYLKDKHNYEQLKETITQYGGYEEEIRFLKENLFEIPQADFKTPLNMICVSHQPELLFIKAIFHNIVLFDSVLKSPDRGFYQIPYAYKPGETGRTHSHHENFNPDFFIKLNDRNEVMVVEIKADDDGRQQTRAKYREGKQHVDILNQHLIKRGLDWQYHFYFLSPEDYSEFLQAIRDNRYPKWKSKLMIDLEAA
jgi:type III restriction enzyme